MSAVLGLRVLGVPAPFLASVIALVLLTIFFGAWAVSSETANSSAYNMAASAEGAVIAPPPDVSMGTEGAEQTPADSWWGGALLKACPFH